MDYMITMSLISILWIIGDIIYTLRKRIPKAIERHRSKVRNSISVSSKLLKIFNLIMSFKTLWKVSSQLFEII